MAMNHRPTVLIGFADAFAAVEATWSLQASGVRVVAFGKAGSRSSLRHVRGVEIYPITAPSASAASAVRDLEMLIAQIKPDAVLPLDDASLWLVDRADVGAAVRVAPDRAGVTLALDKRRQLEAARTVGLTVPPTVVADNARDLASNEWPAVIKPSDAVRLVNDRLERPHGAICASDEEFEAALPSLGEAPVLRQPLISGIGEGVFGFVDGSGPVALSAHRRVRMVNPHGSASSACESVPVDPQLIEPITRMLTDMGWRGLFMVEFLRDADGTPWFMELNGRAWGSLALARRRGYEYPAWAVQHALGGAEVTKYPVDPPHVVARHLGREIAHAAFVFRGPQSTAVTNWPRRGRTIGDLLTIRRRDRLYNWSARQPLVLASDTLGTLTALVAGRKRHA